MGEPERRPDRILVEQFRAGDRDAFTALYRTHFASVYRFTLYMTGDPIRAGEITQDVFVWLIHHPADFDAERGELGAFLGGVARKFLLQQQRNERRWLALNESAMPAADATARGNLVSEIEREQETAQLKQAIAALPMRYREAVVLCDLEAKSYEEAAAEMGCAKGTVRSRLHRARELLVRKFQGRREGQRCL
ncbi:MAG TPA: sigma-70 family RNA polymerase sigma factor [Bryobacteraceae bacterium]|nr:sigma-70 family RNA polymerase sigma factor [Bryobacteraceae bacterium]